MARSEIVFSLSGLEDLEEQTRKYQKDFENCNEEIKRLVEETNSYWVTGELGNYETFKEVFIKNDQPVLQDGSLLMDEFCKLLGTVRGIYGDAGKQIDKDIVNR